ncbi:hypothetical protein V1477_021161 [Vespula maculifrons]|uniref:Uncharacterized protein n=1 Tax=Vespula maculifrons TaxID=7453 RepID=A0ABD2AGX3_VESMC
MTSITDEIDFAVWIIFIAMIIPITILMILEFSYYVIVSSNCLLGLIRGKQMKEYFPYYPNKTRFLHTKAHRTAHSIWAT